MTILQISFLWSIIFNKKLKSFVKVNINLIRLFLDPGAKFVLRQQIQVFKFVIFRHGNGGAVHLQVNRSNGRSGGRVIIFLLGESLKIGILFTYFFKLQKQKHMTQFCFLVVCPIWLHIFHFHLLNKPGLGTGIDPGMALAPFPINFGWDSNQRVEFATH